MHPPKNEYKTSTRHTPGQQDRLASLRTGQRESSAASEAAFVAHALPENIQPSADKPTSVTPLSAPTAAESVIAQPTMTEPELFDKPTGNKLNFSLGCVEMPGTPGVYRSKITVTTLRNGKKKKFDESIMSDQARDLLAQLMRLFSRDDDLHRVIARFLGSDPLPD